MNLPEPQTKQFTSLIDDVSTGRLKIPQFQRAFIWERKKSAELLDSIVKGYPIGTFIFWKTNERLRSVRNVGGLVLPEPPRDDKINFVLDGQQRITSLFAAFKGEKILRGDGKEEDYSEIYIDLDAKEDEKIVTTELEGKKKEQIIKLRDLLYGDLTTLTQYPQKYHKSLAEYKKRIESYNYSVIQVNDVSIDVATEIFTRINVGGKPLTLFEIMVAKTYDYDSDFDLAQKFDSLLESLRIVNYDTISDAVVLQVVSLILRNECQRKDILSIDKKDFINCWGNAVNAIESAIDYFRGFYRIPVSRLLPYNALIAPFAYFFHYHKDKPTGDKQRFLQDFFWRVALSGRYSSGVEGKLAQDIKRINKILLDQLPDYEWPINTSNDFVIRNGWFSAGRSYVKAILCIYAFNQPKSFIDDSIVNISNDWLKQANSKNYHHFFPRAYLEKTGIDEQFINNVLNITIVDDFLNKRVIREKSPSSYMANFKKKNPNLSETMKSHLIANLDKFGVWADNYPLFLVKRGEAVSQELDKRIIKQEIDVKQQADILEDEEAKEIS